MKILDIKTAIGNFRDSKLLTLLNIAGLGTAFAIAIIIFNYVHHEFQADKYHQNLENIYLLKNKNEAHVGYDMDQLIEEQIPAIKHVSLVWSGMKNEFILSDGKEHSIQSELVFTDDDFSSIFSLDVVYGSLHEALAEPKTIILTESESKLLFGNVDPTGEVISLKGNKIFFGSSDVEVKAVIKDFPENSNLQFKAATSFATARQMMPWIEGCGWNCRNVLNYVVIDQNHNPEELARQMSEQLRPLIPESNNCEFSFLPYEEVFFSNVNDDFKHGNMKLIYILGSIAILILLIATINYINLTLAGSSTRLTEVGLKKIAGAVPGQIVIQFLVESVILSMLALMAGMLLAWFIIPPVNSLSVIDFPEIPFSSVYFWLISICTAAVIGVFAGLTPSIAMAKFRPISLLTGKSNGHFQGINLKRGLIVSQFVISIVLIISTMTVIKQLTHIKKTDLGFNVENVINIKLSPDLDMITFKDKLYGIPEVHSVSYSRWFPGNIRENWGMPLNNNGKVEDVSFACENADAAYVDVMGLEIIQGRNFSNRSSDVDMAIVNEAFVRAFGLEDPLNAYFQKRDVVHKIIGVVKDFNYQSLHNDIGPMVIFCADEFLYSVNVRLVARDYTATKAALDKIEASWKEESPDFPFDFNFIDDHVQSLYKMEIVYEKVFRYASIFAIFISCLGLFGLVLSSTERRRKEIGIRRVNGASISGIVWMLNRDFIKWVIIAFVLASPLAAYLMNKWLENFAYRIKLSWWIFVISGLLALGIAVLTVSWQSWKTARRNPADSLRYE